MVQFVILVDTKDNVIYMSVTHTCVGTIPRKRGHKDFVRTKHKAGAVQ